MSLKKLFLFLFLIGNVTAVVLFWWQNSNALFSNTAGSLIALGRLAGLFAELSIATQFLLMGRISFVEQEFGHDKLNRLHRYIGYSIGLFLLSHPTLLILGYSQSEGKTFFGQITEFLLNYEDVFKAAIGLIILIAIISISLPFFRKQLKYEHWYGVHLFVYLVFILIIQHQTNFGDFEGRRAWVLYWQILNYGIVGLLVLHRFIRPLYRFYYHGFVLDKIIPETPDATSLYISGHNLEGFKFKPGQFANLTFLNKKMFFTHPFSFSLPQNGKSIRFSVKASGDFTNKIRQLPIGTKVIIEGPLGRFTQDPAPQADKFLFLAGGIGITPIRSLIESLAGQNKDIVLLYSNKRPEDILFKTELENLKHRYHFIMTQVVEKPGQEQYETGRIDREKILRLVPDFKLREIYICGPIEMIDALKNLLLNLGANKDKIHFEKFSY